jgi:glycosyltransferase involved in cell wall biosynthesis
MPGPMTKKIKILECIRQGQIGGGESHLLSLAENLDRDNFNPVVLSFTDGPMVEQLNAMNVPTRVIHTTRPFDISKWAAVKRFLQKEKFDLVHAHGTRAASNVLWAARTLDIPVIYTVHGWSFHQDQNKLVRNIRISGEKYLTSKTAVNISVSLSNQQSGKKFIPLFKSIVINNGINQNKFNPQKRFKNIRLELGIPENSFLVLFVARFTAHKQPLALIEAFAKALTSNPNLHLLMVGDGDQRNEADVIIKQYGLQHKITLESFRKDVPDILAAADVFVLPSLWEGLPIGLLEAMAMGKAVIATNVDGTSEVITHNKNGMLIETDGLVQNLTEALLKLSVDKEMKSRFERNAMKTIDENYDAADMTRRIEQVYLQTAVLGGVNKEHTTVSNQR